jgi:hypothetical protein
MKRTTKFVATAATAALTAALLPGAVASGNAGTITGGGVLRLHMGADADFIKFLPATGSGGSTSKQKLLSKNCAASLSPSWSLVTLSSTPAPPDGVVGLLGHSLGVKTKAESSYSPTCAQVNGTAQALTLALGDSLTDKKIDFAELDIATFGTVTVRADTYLDGVLEDTTLLPIGSSASTATSAPKGGVNPLNRRTNVRWLLDPPSLFDKVVFSVDASTPKGAFELEGGVHGTPPVPGGVGASLHTSDSVFQLSDFNGTLDCGESSGDIGEPGQPGADLTRGENADCKPIPFLLRTGSDESEQFVLLQKDLTGQEDANFTMELTWAPEPAHNPLPPTTIDYDGPGGADPTPVVFCGGTSSNPTPVEGQAWCVFKQKTEIVGDGQVRLTEDYFGSGDPRWAR